MTDEAYRASLSGEPKNRGALTSRIIAATIVRMSPEIRGGGGTWPAATPKARFNSTPDEALQRIIGDP